MSCGRKPALAETSNVERTANMRSLATRCAPIMNLPTLCWRAISAMICGVSSCQGGCRMLSDEYRVSHLAAPLRIGDRVIGALCVGSPAQNHFAAESADMLTKLANVAVIALENARLFAQAERVATLEERRRVAAEMHDGLGQTLSYLGLMTDQVVEFLSDGRGRLRHSNVCIKHARRSAKPRAMCAARSTA